MKEKVLLSAPAVLCLLLTGCGAEGEKVKIWPILLLILAVPLLALAVMRTYGYARYLIRRIKSRRPINRRLDLVTIGIYALVVIFLFAALLGSCTGKNDRDAVGDEIPVSEAEPTEEPTEEPPVTIELQDSWSEVAYDRQVTAPIYFAYDLKDDVYITKSPGLEQSTIYPASITKLFTGYVALRYLEPYDEIMVGDERTLVDSQAAVAGIYWGDRLTTEELITAMLLPSGNDAAYTLATAVGRILGQDDAMEPQMAINRFVQQMNTQAMMEGMTGSHFANPDGMHSEDHYVTAQDLAIMAKLVLEDPLLASCTLAAEDTVTLSEERELHWENSNKLVDPESVYYCPYAVGLKTGYTEAGGECLLAAFSVENEQLLVGVFGNESKDACFADVIWLFTQAYDAPIPAPAGYTEQTDAE